MIEYDIEEKLIGSLRQIKPLQSAQVQGAWQVACDGIKGTQYGKAVQIAVGVSPRRYNTFGICPCQMDCDIVVVVFADKCPGGADIRKVADGVIGLLENLHRNVNSLREELSTDDFVPDGLMTSAGTRPTYDSQNGCWTMTFSFTVAGHVIDENGK